MPADLGAVEDFADGKFTIVAVDGQEMGVLRTGEEYLVVRNTCPHAGAPVCTGYLTRGLSGSAPGELVISQEEARVLVCPWHRWQFRLSDGRCTNDPTVRLRVYAAYVDDGRVLTDMRAARPPRSRRVPAGGTA